MPAKPERILLIRPDHLGDLLLTTPALRQLRSSLPAAHIALLVGPWNAAAAGGLEGVDEVLTLPFPYFDRQPKRGPLAPYTLLRSEARKLSAHHFDTSVVFRHDHWWGAALAARAGIQRRAGWDDPQVEPFLTYVASDPPEHEAERALRLGEALLGTGEQAVPPMRFVPSDGDMGLAAEWLGQLPPRSSYVVIHPGSGGAVKLWPARHWAAVADALGAQYGVAVVVSGSAAEASLVAEVCSGCRVTSPVRLTGVGVGQLAATLAGAALVLGPDSGVLHLAEAVGRPTVRLFGPASVDRFGPWQAGDRHRVLRASLPCIACGRLDFPAEELAQHPCVRSITESQVLAAAQAVLGAASVAR